MCDRRCISRINLKLALDDVEVARRCAAGKSDVEGGGYVWKPFQIPENDPLVRKMCPFGPYDHLYYKYNSTNEEQQALVRVAGMQCLCVSEGLRVMMPFLS